jgi:hypothetical protein
MDGYLLVDDCGWARVAAACDEWNLTLSSQNNVVTNAVTFLCLLFCFIEEHILM